VDRYLCYPYLALTMFAVLGADLAIVARHYLAPVVFVPLWTAVALIAGWGWLVCVPSALAVMEGQLVYETPMASGVVRLSRVRGLRPAPLGGAAALVRIRGRVPLLVPIRGGFAPVAARLSRHPSVLPGLRSSHVGRL